MVRLMMACNDFSLANKSLGTWRKPKTRKEEMRAPGALRYFLRLQVSHVCEAMNIIDEIERSATLRAAVDAADRRTQVSYDSLRRFKKSPRWKTMKLIRNKVAFHYDPAWVKQAIGRLDMKNPRLRATISMGNEALDWYFEPADMVEDSIVVRQIFNIPEGAEVRVETDKILVELQGIAAAFGDFAGYFVKHHSK
jgi:hypothetical protein